MATVSSYCLLNNEFSYQLFFFVNLFPELPHAAPTLFTERDRYDAGDILKANCSTPPSKPGATIT